VSLLSKAIKTILSVTASLSGRPVFLFGQFRAAQILPAIAKSLLSSSPAVHVAGIGVNSPAVHPSVLAPLASDYALQLGIIDQWQHSSDILQHVLMVQSGEVVTDQSHYSAIIEYIDSVSGGITQQDVRTFEPYTDTLNMLKAIVTTAYPSAAAKQPFQMCSDIRGPHFPSSTSSSWFDPPSPQLPSLASAAAMGIKVLVYSGRFDMTSPPAAVDALFPSLYNSTKLLWLDDQNSTVAFIKQDQNITYVSFASTGAVPSIEYGQYVLTMLDCFTNGKPIPAYDDGYTPVLELTTGSTNSRSPQQHRRPAKKKRTSTTGPSLLKRRRRLYSDVPTPISLESIPANNEAAAKGATCVSRQMLPGVSSSANIGSLPNEDGCVGHAGYMTVDSFWKPIKSNLFFWMFEAADRNKTSPVVIWLNGGPGCSSLFGLFEEDGPFSVSANQTLVANPWSWNRNNAMLYIEQPVHTGFSFTSNGNDDQSEDKSYSLSTEDAADVFYRALVQLYQRFPSLRTRPLYITGESYAGHYIPTYAYWILQGNGQQTQGSTDLIPLKGIGVGNGLVEMRSQFNGFTHLMYALGFLDSKERDALQKIEDLVEYGTKIKRYLDASQLWDDHLYYLGKFGGDFDIYDMRVFSGSKSYFVPYLNTMAVQAALHTKPTNWTDCDDTVYKYMWADMSRSVAYTVPYLLQSGLHVMLFSGQFDGICPCVMEAQFVDLIDWPSQADFRASPRQVWRTSDGKVGGFIKAYDNLAWVTVYGAGHMVPTDRPMAAFHMFQHFVSNQPLVAGYPVHIKKPPPYYREEEGNLTTPGVVTGIVVGAVLLLAFAIFMYRRVRRRVREAVQGLGHSGYGPVGPGAEADVDSEGARQRLGVEVREAAPLKEARRRQQMIMLQKDLDKNSVVIQKHPQSQRGESEGRDIPHI